MKTRLLFLALSLVALSVSAQKESVSPKPAAPAAYGENITLEAAKKLAAAAEAFAIEKQWTIIVVIVDTGGNPVILHKMDNTQIGSLEVAMGKAKTANNFKRSTKSFEDVVAGGGAGLRILNVPGILPVEGGEPIYSNGKIIGAIGISGMSSAQDGEVVKAALAAK